MRVLVAEDELLLAKQLISALGRAGYAVDHAADSRQWQQPRKPGGGNSFESAEPLYLPAGPEPGCDDRGAGADEPAGGAG